MRYSPIWHKIWSMNTLPSYPSKGAAHRTAPYDKRRPGAFSLALTLALASLVTLSACNRTQEPTADTATAAASAAAAALNPYEHVAQSAKGFTAGAIMSANTVYVLFDPQCPHCGHLWQASQPLLKKVKFVWVPVAIINSRSLPQGAAILSADNPIDAMTAHETSLLAGNGGTSASSSVPEALEKTIKDNSAVFAALKGESVPMIVAKNATTGAVVVKAGAMETGPLANLLGVAAP